MFSSAVRTETIARLRDQIARIEHGDASRPPRSLPFGIPALPPLLLGCLHEAAGAGPDTEHGAAAAQFLAGVLARMEGPVLWVQERPDLFAPGLACAGLHPARVLFAEAGKDVLAAMEEGLTHPGLAAVVGEYTGRLSLVASRRLQLGAEKSGVTAALLRRSRMFNDPELAAPSAAVTRWRIAALPSAPPVPNAPSVPGLGRALWRLELTHHRGGEPGSWIVEACDATGRLALAANLAHGPAAELGGPPDGPLVTAEHDGRKRVIAAVDAMAAHADLYPGMPVAQAQALVSDLTVMEARPEEDVAALRRLAGWCLRYAPLAAAEPPGGVWIDVTGSTHLHGGETRLLRDLVSRLLAQGFAARAAVADTPGAAHAMARFGAEEVMVVPAGGQQAALARLPVAALRLPVTTLDGLRLMGIETVAALAALPRAPLVRRFGALVTTRLDQAFGRVAEAIEPAFPPESIQSRLTFVEPLLTPEAFATVIDRLVSDICADMERSGNGARRLDLVFERVDGTTQAIRIGTARASRDARHLARLLKERIERVDPGLGVEAMRLVVPGVDALMPVQLSATNVEEPDIAPLIDRLANRLGPERVYRVAPVDSAVPERSVRRVRDMAVGTWPEDLPRPVRLLDPPQPVEAMALLPDHPPMAFTWRRVRHRVRRADGPERIAGEWWKRGGEMRSVRDYFRVEDEDGHRYWLFRRGDGENGVTGDMRWFLHGFF